MPQAAAPPRAARRLQTVRTFGRWDCINARQRERAKESRFAACTPVLRSPASRRPPPKYGAFRLSPQRSLLRQTGCWRKPDSNPWSHLDRAACPAEDKGRTRAAAALLLLLCAIALTASKAMSTRFGPLTISDPAPVQRQAGEPRSARQQRPRLRQEMRYRHIRVAARQIFFAYVAARIARTPRSCDSVRLSSTILVGFSLQK